MCSHSTQPCKNIKLAIIDPGDEPCGIPNCIPYNEDLFDFPHRTVP